MKRIDLPGGWSLVKCTDRDSMHDRDWFLADTEGMWVAKFWDGPGTGKRDCIAFAKSLGVKVKKK
jgi:hypothetical protein